MHVREARPTRRSFLSRRGKALAFALLYLVAVLGLPSLHLGLHRDNHDHRDGGIHFHAQAAAELPASFTASLHGHDHGPFHATVLDESAGVVGRADGELRKDLAEFQSTAAGAQSCRLTGTPASSETPPDLPHVNGSLAHFASAFLSAAENPFHLLVGPAIGTAGTQAASEQAPKPPFPRPFGARGPPAC